MSTADRQGLAKGPLRQMHAIGLHRRGEARVGADQEDQAPLAGQGSQPPGLIEGPRRAKGPEHDPRSPRQPRHNRRRIGGARRVGEEKQGRQGLSRSGPAI